MRGFVEMIGAVMSAAPTAAVESPEMDLIEQDEQPEVRGDAHQISDEALENDTQNTSSINGLLDWLNAPAPEETPAADLPAAPGRAYALAGRDLEKTLAEIFKRIDAGAAGAEEFEALANACEDPQGADRIGSALEAVVSGPDGPKRLLELMRLAAQTAAGRRAFASVLARTAAVNAARTAGTLLLLTDGTDGLAETLSELADEKTGALRLAEMLRLFGEDEKTAGGLAELLETLTESRDGDRGNAARVARSMAESARWVSGARDLTQTFTSMLETQGGGRALARLLQRMSATREGALDAGRTLRSMSFDREGTNAVARMLVKATQSQAGAKDVLVALSRMGERDVTIVLRRLVGVDAGVKLLANLAAEKSLAETLADLLDRLGEVTVANGAGVDRARLMMRASGCEWLHRVLVRLGFESAGQSTPVSAQGMGLMARMAVRHHRTCRCGNPLGLQPVCTRCGDKVALAG